MNVTDSILGAPAGLTGTPAISNGFRPLPLFHSPPDAAGSGGNQPGAGGGQQQQSGGGGGQQQQQQAGAGGGQQQHARFDPNATYDFGDGKPVKGSDYLAGFVPKTQYDQVQTNYQKGRDFLIAEATRLEGAWKQLQGQIKSRQQQQPGAQTSPLDKFKDAPIIDGNALSEAYQAMREGDIAPLQKLVQLQQQKITQLEKSMQQFGKGFGSISEQQQAAQHSSMVEGVIKSLGNGFDPANQLLRDLADDVYMSHDPNDQNLQREFPAMFKARIEGLRKLFREMDKAAIEQAKNTRRTFTRPGGNASPNGEVPYQHENGASLARRFFGQTAANQT